MLSNACRYRQHCGLMKMFSITFGDSMNETQQYQQDHANSNNPLLKLWNGDAGLAKSYWLWGVAAGFVWGIALGVTKPVPGSASAQILLSLIAAYFVFAYVGIWRAANKYQGKKAWVTLAKFAVVLGALVTILPLRAIFVEKFVS